MLELSNEVAVDESLPALALTPVRENALPLLIAGAAAEPELDLERLIGATVKLGADEIGGPIVTITGDPYILTIGVQASFTRGKSLQILITRQQQRDRGGGFLQPMTS